MRPIGSGARLAAAAAAALVISSSSYAQQGDGAPYPAERDALGPDWRGIWFMEGAEEAGISGVTFDDSYRPPLMNPEGPWTEQGRAELFKVFERGASRKAPGWGYRLPTPSFRRRAARWK